MIPESILYFVFGFITMFVAVMIFSYWWLNKHNDDYIDKIKYEI